MFAIYRKKKKRSNPSRGVEVWDLYNASKLSEMYSRIAEKHTFRAIGALNNVLLKSYPRISHR